jgi:hypothetical protein
MKQANISIFEVLEGEEKQKGIENIVNEILAENRC